MLWQQCVSLPRKVIGQERHYQSGGSVITVPVLGGDLDDVLSLVIF